MKPINFAYDGEVANRYITWHWHYNTYDQRYYPINGLWEECYYDYHAPLQTVLENNNITTKSITMQQALCSTDPFVYVLTFRYLANTIRNHHARKGINGIPVNFNFFEHLPIGLVKAINTGQCLLILNDAHESNYYSVEDYILLKNKLTASTITNFNNIILLTGNMSNDVIDKDIQILHWQYFETAMRMSSDKQKKINKDHDNLKKFLCLNRMPREIRYYFMYQIWNKSLMSEFNASLKNVNDITEISSYNNNEFMDKIKDQPNFKTMLNSLPWVIDSPNFNNNHWDNIEYDFTARNLIFITTETLFSSDSSNLFLTEKTFKPMALGMPFIVIGNPYILKHLRSLGYKTFNTLWDESYDEEFDCHKRMEKIIQLVEDISKKHTTEQLNTLIEEHKHILEHNYNLLMERRPEQAVIEFINNRRK
jgi:UDP-2,3-diacylglucosamine pyrophosphatase LpxH